MMRKSIASRFRFVTGLSIALLLPMNGDAANIAGSDVLAAEYRIKAAFLYHFCNYVKWPDTVFEDSRQTFVIGVAAPAPVVEELRKTFGSRQAYGKPIEIRTMRPDDPLDGLQMLYIASPMRAATFHIATDDSPLLTITESDDGLDTGGIINFVIENDRVRFDVSLEAAKERQLDIRAQLLTVARNIRGSAG